MGEDDRGRHLETVAPKNDVLFNVAAALAGWFVAGFTLTFSVPMGMAWVYGEGLRSAAVLFPFFHLFTLPMLLVRALTTHDAGLWVAAFVGGVAGLFYLPVTHDLFVPFRVSESAYLWDWAAGVFLFSGALAGACWWLVEDFLRRDRRSTL